MENLSIELMTTLFVVFLVAFLFGFAIGFMVMAKRNKELESIIEMQSDRIDKMEIINQNECHQQYVANTVKSINDNLTIIQYKTRKKSLEDKLLEEN